MASISSLMGSTSSSSSIYGSRNSNIISGLASGLDTESMIEGMVESYKQKITSLQQSKTKLQWKQTAYQSISDKLVEFSRKYTSYTSSTNLFSSSFFNNAVITTAKGDNADLITAVGKSNSNIVINGVSQLATAARYSISASQLSVDGTTAKGDVVNLSDPMIKSEMSGSLKISYGTQTLWIDFDETEDFSKADGTLDTDKFQQAIIDKLSEQELRNQDGDMVSASDCIGVSVKQDGTVELTNKQSGGDSVYIAGALGDFKEMVSDLDSAVSDKKNTFHVRTDVQVADKSVSKAEYLSDTSFSVTLNGQTKTITLGKITQEDNGGVVKALQAAIDDAFGAGKVTVSSVRSDGGDSSVSGAITFQTSGSGNTFSISAKDAGAGKILFGEDNTSLTTYLNTQKTLGQLGSFDASTGKLTIGGEVLQGTAIQVDPKDWVRKDDGTYTDKDGNKLDSQGYRINKDGERLYEFDLTINGEKIGSYTQDTALETVMNGINSNTDAGVNVSYSQLTNQFVFTAKNTGESEKIDIGEGLGKALFGDSSNYEHGTDAKITATINGQVTELTRSSNSIDLDGLTVTLNGTFEAEKDSGDKIIKDKGVSFTTKTDTDTIVDAIKQMVTDFNAMITEIKSAYSDMPLQQSNGAKYEPLTADDEEGMSESEIEAYEEKAKTGLLFMDRDLSSLYSSLRDAVISVGSDGSYLRSIGIQTSYEDGLTTISLDETALRSALETDLDGVRNAFAKSTETGSATDGLMASIEKVTDKYAATTGAVKGILIEKAGSKYAPTAALDNTLLDQMNELDDQISTWQDKMSDKVDYYTNKFTQLEMLINQMNSQSSALSGLMGGYTG